MIPTAVLLAATRGGNPTLESDEELQRQQKGGKRAYEDRVGKDRNAHESRLSTASTKYHR
jgi:hypothetical protein